MVEEMRRTALEAIDVTGPATLPTRWEESARIFLIQGGWTVTVSVSGTDHVAVREAYTTQLGTRKAAILADAQNRIPRIPGPLPRANPNSPDKVRAAWRRNRRQGTAPKPASGAFAPGSWVTWAHPETGAVLTGVVTGWLHARITWAKPEASSPQTEANRS
ncbi:hypothetical protein RVR_P13 (plasmid) [Actinacidiphila reveromycinica]|uniref:Uncharacterized protein n=1 Tax=Actinacidiphila reveromycinica TaxID=659352 RepID=A0A7U3QW34_9ACTN|nr:hypothetical protein RVR_P13 [Streptomyces sp. SN-593]